MITQMFPYGMQQYLIGGLLIGTGIALLFVTTGRLGGASTFFSAAWSYVMNTPFFQQPLLRGTRQWRSIYALGLLLGGVLYAVLGLPILPSAMPAWKLALGGVFIGFGARLGGGCTSGHGVCGVCPGPALSGVGAGNFDLLIALAGIFAGAWLHGLWANRQLGKQRETQQFV